MVFYRKPKYITAMDAAYHQDLFQKEQAEHRETAAKNYDTARKYEAAMSQIASLKMCIGKLTESIVILRDAK